jgi:hypothetical protein
MTMKKNISMEMALRDKVITNNSTLNANIYGVRSFTIIDRGLFSRKK